MYIEFNAHAAFAIVCIYCIFGVEHAFTLNAYVRNDARIVEIYYAAHTASKCILDAREQRKLVQTGFHVHFSWMQNNMKKK